MRVPPEEPGLLLRAAQSSFGKVGNGAGLRWATQSAADPLPDVQMIQSVVFLILIADEIPDRCLIVTECRQQISPSPENAAQCNSDSEPSMNPTTHDTEIRMGSGPS